MMSVRKDLLLGAALFAAAPARAFAGAWPAESLFALPTPDPASARWERLAWGGDGRWVVVVSSQGEAVIVDPRTGRTLHRLAGPDGLDGALRVEGERVLLATGGRITAWRMNDGRKLASWDTGLAYAMELSRLEDGRLVASGSARGEDLPADLPEESTGDDLGQRPRRPPNGLHPARWVGGPRPGARGGGEDRRHFPGLARRAPRAARPALRAAAGRPGRGLAAAPRHGRRAGRRHGLLSRKRRARGADRREPAGLGPGAPGAPRVEQRPRARGAVDGVLRRRRHPRRRRRARPAAALGSADRAAAGGPTQP